MKTLLLMRHAKSSWKQLDLPDQDRPLKRRGKEAAWRMGQLLRELDLIPDLVLTSAAVRAHETAMRVAKASQFDGDLQVEMSLYHAEPGQLAQFVSQVPDRCQRVLVVGHNPGLSDWLNQLTEVNEEFPTAALAQIELPIERWQDLTSSSRGSMHGIWRPRELALSNEE